MKDEIFWRDPAAASYFTNRKSDRPAPTRSNHHDPPHRSLFVAPYSSLNYHGVICVQLCHHGRVSTDQCAAFLRDVIRLPMPTVCARTGLVYPPDYSVNDAPRPHPETSDAASSQSTP